MTTSNTNKGCSVFVGNVDFDIDEATIKKELSAAGTVVNFRMMYDKATGKSKGYGFCEYETPEIAEKARNSLNIVFNGRVVKINYAENDMPQKVKEEPETSKSLCIDTIIKVIEEMEDASAIKEIFSYLKQMAINQPNDLNNLLKENPNLCCAVMYLLIKSKMVDEKVVLDIFKDSLNLNTHKNQINERITMLSMKGLSLETISALEKLKEQILNDENDE